MWFLGHCESLVSFLPYLPLASWSLRLTHRWGERERESKHDLVARHSKRNGIAAEEEVAADWAAEPAADPGCQGFWPAFRALLEQQPMPLPRLTLRVLDPIAQRWPRRRPTLWSASLATFPVRQREAAATCARCAAPSGSSSAKRAAPRGWPSAQAGHR